MEAQLSAAGAHCPVLQDDIFRFQLTLVHFLVKQRLSLAPLDSPAQVPGAVTAAAGPGCAQGASFAAPQTLLAGAMQGKWL